MIKERTELSKNGSKKLFLIDGAALAYRSYFAFIRNPLFNSKGMNTSAIYGFASVLLKIIKEIKPDYIGVVFDSKEPTERHEKYGDYKATREKMPDEMVDQLPYIEKLVKAFSIPFIAVPKIEADDLIGSAAAKFAAKNLVVNIVSGDKDLMQLINNNVRLYNAKKAGEVEIYDAEGVKKKFGVGPEKIIDLLSLMGDSSDNIPGIPGVGPKTALKLLEQFGSLEEVLENSEKVSNKRISQLIKDNRGLALLSKDLVTIRKNIPLKVTLEDLRLTSPNNELLKELFGELEFDSLLEKIEASSNNKTAGKNYACIDSKEKLEKLIKDLKGSDLVAFDTETSGTDPMDCDLVGISFSMSAGEAFYIPFNLKKNGSLVFSRDETLSLLKVIFEDDSIRKGGHNIKYDYLVMKRHGVEVKGISFDTMIESYLIEPSARAHNLDSVTMKNLGIKKTPIEELIGKGKDQIGIDQAEIADVSDYSCEDADMSLRLHAVLMPKIEEMGLNKLYEKVEIPLVLVLSEMEWEGISVDLDFLKKLSKKVEEEADKLQKKIIDEAGQDFNINSPKQLGKIIFDKLQIHKKLGIKRIKKTKTGFSTDVSVLETLSVHPMISNILEYRNLSKLRSTYLDSLPQIMNKNTGRIHTSFNQTVTATGRLSSSEPNLQNIPIRTPLGKEIRKAFVPGKKGCEIISADYSQIELRILAHLSKDKNLIKTFKDEVDVHTRTAATIFGVDDSKVNQTLRSRAKAINFGIIYGMGPQRLARETKISMQEAQDFINSYFEKYPGIKKYIEDQVEFAQKNEFVKTIYDRRRDIPEISSSNPRLRINAEHIAVNTPIQGSAADLIKVAMINIQSRLKSQEMNTKMILQVHDELVFEAPRDETKKVIEMVRREMENAIELTVPIKVEIKSGNNWFEAH